MPALTRGSIRLVYGTVGEGETGPPVVLLHGLAGYAGEWTRTAQRLASTHQIVAPDQRGHGRSTRRPDDMSRAAYVDDAIAIIEHLAAGPAILVGQSLGGHTALLVAAKRPDLVAALIVAEATPARDPDAPERIRHALSTWPVPFASREAAAAYFLTTGWCRTLGAAQTWAAGLADDLDGYGPCFTIEAMATSLQEIVEQDYWAEWTTIACPTLVVRGTLGMVTPEQMERMVAAVPTAQAATIADAGHDVHLDQPEPWETAVTDFLQRLDPS